MIKAENLTKNYNGISVLQDLSIELPENQITAILGPSGCGKTTFLNILAGLVKPDGGTTNFKGEVSYLFQEPRLLPWLTVCENIALVLRDKLKPEEIEKRVLKYMNAFGILQYSSFYPGQLSGGLRQRVALARAFAYDAPLLLMDEPFKSLDIKTRYQLIQDFIGLWEESPRTVVTVTHDVKEAVWIADKVVVFSDKPVRGGLERKIEMLREERVGSNQVSVIEQEVLDEIINSFI